MINKILSVSDLLANRARGQSISLHWGSHIKEYGIDPYINEFLVEPSPNVVLQAKDPVIQGYLQRHAFSDRAIFRLNGASFDAKTGNVFLGKHFVRESLTGRSSLPIRPPSRAKKLPSRPIIGVPFNTWYHWLVETLPRVIAAARFEPNALLVASDTLHHTQRQAIEMLGKEVFYTNDHFICDEMILATRGLDSGWAHPQDMELLRRTYNIPLESSSHKAFVTRVNSSRSDQISQEIQDFAESVGWTIVRAEKISWNDHLEIFGKSSHICGEHGAGLANVALSPLGTKLYEISRSEYANPCFEVLSAVLNGTGTNHNAFSIEDFRIALR
jgi:hypothetical protein